MTTVELSGEEARLQDAYDTALSNFESMAAANHRTASEPAVLNAVQRADTEALFVLCNLSALNFARVMIPDFLSITPRKGLFGRRKSGNLAETGKLACEVQLLIDQLLADGFVAGAAMAALRNEPLETDSNTFIYPDQAIQWYWENASESIWEELDADPVASDILHTVSSGDVALISRRADDAQRKLGLTPDPILSSTQGEYMARRGYALYWVHTKTISERFAKEHIAWAAKSMSTRPLPPTAP
jgi:hypothetical protein